MQIKNGSEPAPAFFPTEFLEEIALSLGLSKLAVRLRPEWGSQVPTSRNALQENLRAELATASLAQTARAKNQTESRESTSVAEVISSVSHTLDLGGFAMASPAGRLVMVSPASDFERAIAAIGFDVEQVARVKASVVRRVCLSEAEYAQAPSPHELWSAKEAAFKSLRGWQQPQVLSAVEVFDWSDQSQFKIFRYKLQASGLLLNGSGVSWMKDRHQFALAVSSNTNHR